MTELDCKDVKALLSGLIDGELDDSTRHLAERHLVDCKPCRDLVNETEKLNALLALEGQRQALPAGLPARFEDAVLRQTVYAEAYQFAGRRWTSWLGWVAAAACLGLAASMWFLNPQVVRSGEMNMAAQNQPSQSPRSAINSSWTYSGNLSPDALAAARSAGRRDISGAELRLNPQVASVVDEQLASVMPATYTTRPAREPEITREDAETLFAVSNLLEKLKNADLRSFKDVEQIRQIAEYDDLLPRLAQSHERLSPAEQPVVMAAESILLRIVNGPLSADDLTSLHNSVVALDLPAQVQTISNRWQPAASL